MKENDKVYAKWRKTDLFLCAIQLVSCFLFLGCTEGDRHVLGGRDDGLVLVKGGRFEMGDVWGDGGFAMTETPVHHVELGDFFLAKHEVTVEEFARFVEATGYRTLVERGEGVRVTEEQIKEGKTRHPSWKAHWFEQGARHPAVWLAWEDAIAYCNWLSRRHSLPPAYDESSRRLLDASGGPATDVRQVRGFRLPTEAEWEFAARERGRKVRFGNGQDIARATEMNFDAEGAGEAVPSLRLPAENRYPYNEKGHTRGQTTEVGSFRANALGLYDMSGNAWEWCCDTGGWDYTEDMRINPCMQEGSGHVVRGGTYDTDARACRASARIDWYDGSQCEASGFRVARTAE